jgi:DegV family protein with EDD domain
MIVLMVKELEEQGLPFEQIVEKTEAMIYNADTYFTLDNLETLRKNGRLSKMKGLAATLLKIKPICFGNKDGEIEQIGQARGSNKALLKMVEMIAQKTVDPENKVLGISHTNCHERAVMVRDAILSRIKVKEVVMVETAGLSTTYANDGGIIVVI